MTFLLRRLLASLLQIAAASVLTFALFTLVPGDFYSTENFNPQRSPAAIEHDRQSAGLRQSWPARYATWIESCAVGEFGVSLAYGMPVGRLLAPRLRATMNIALPAFLLAWLAGLALALAAQRRPGLVNGSFTSLAAASALIPDGIAVSVLLWLAVRLGTPITGPPLPILGLAFALFPVVFLHAAAGLANARQQLFVRLAQQRGLSGARLWLRYILPAAANPLVSLLGLSFAAAIGSSLLVEALTGWPGLGPLFLEAVQSRDYPIVQSVLLLLTIALALANLATDLLLYRLDPRIRTAR